MAKLLLLISLLLSNRASMLVSLNYVPGVEKYPEHFFESQ